jgi:hypothetical protein
MAELIDDARHDRLQRRYTAPRMAPAPVRPDRSIFATVVSIVPKPAMLIEDLSE